MGTIAVVGTGLIGGSLGLALRRAGLRVQGYDTDAERLARALSRGVIDEAAPSLLDAYAGADAAFIAVTVSGVAGAVAAALDAGVGAVSDVGSVKAPVLRAVEAQTGFARTHTLQAALFDSPEYKALLRVHGQLIELAGTPSFQVRLGDVKEAAASFEALRDAVMKVTQKGVRLQRFKGLGEMNADQLGETTMAPATRVLAQVTLEDAAAADRIFSMLRAPDEVSVQRAAIVSISTGSYSKSER